MEITINTVEHGYDDSIVLLMYKDTRVARGLYEDLRGRWYDDFEDCASMQEFLEIWGYTVPELSQEDNELTWEDIDTQLEWDDSIDGYVYGNFKLFILDL